MSLKGSLQTVALPEVLNFLADNGKSGEFHVSGGHGEGRLWFGHGRISGLDVARAEQPFEAIFELLRIDDGEFDFVADVEVPAEARPVGFDDGVVRPALEAAEARLAEWRDIVTVVPSLAHRLQLRSETPAEAVMLEPEQWMLVVAIGAGHTVGQVIDERGMQEFDGCKAVRALVDASLVDVLEPEAAEAVAEDPEPVAEEPDPEPVAEEVAPEPVALEPEPVAEEADTAPAAGEYNGFSPLFSPFEVSASHAAQDDEVGQADLEGDHYAALRAAMVEIGEDLVADQDQPGGEEAGYPVYELHADPEMDGRAALQALLNEVTEDTGSMPAPATDEVVDGLADRGPWTDHELSTMDGQSDFWIAADEKTSEEDDSNIVPFGPAQADTGAAGEADAVAEEADAVAEEPEEAPPAEEPINRGLLLKFLSSVRN